MGNEWQPVQGHGLMLGCIAGLILWAIIIVAVIVCI